MIKSEYFVEYLESF